MPRNNPVRGQYVLDGTDLVRAGIRRTDDGLAIVREDSGTAIDVVDPASVRWLTSRAVARAAAMLPYAVSMAAVPFNKDIAAIIRTDPKAGFRFTEDHIVHMLGGETPVRRKYAQDQVAELVVTYSTASAAA